MHTLALTYANDRQNDGAGAQLHRIYGIYALARHLGLPYVHSPLARVGYHGLRALEANAELPGLEARFNRVFTLPSDVAVPGDHVVREAGWLQPEELEAIRETAQRHGGFTLCRIEFPFGIADRHPEMYRCVADVSPFRKPAGGVLRVGIHVRRGELFVFQPDRMLPNSYYVNCARRVAALLDRLSLPFVCELYTEVPTKSFLVRPGHYWVGGHVTGDVVFRPEMNAIEDFDAIPNLGKRVNLDPIETLEGLATSDILIMSRSSFSYVAAILNRDAAVICHRFWHGLLPEWIESAGDGSFPEAALAERLGTRGGLGT